MKKRVLSVILALLLLSMPLSMPALAASSFALEVATTLGNTYTFSSIAISGGYTANDTETLKSIKINLPSTSDAGDLRYEGKAITSNTPDITLANMHKLTFVPKAIGHADFSVTATANDDSTVDGTIRVVVRVQAEELHLTTNINTPVRGTLSGTDSAGRALTYRITDSNGDPLPAPTVNTAYAPHADIVNGEVRAVSGGLPAFEFTPNDGFIGLASFWYTVELTSDGSTKSAPTQVLIYVGGRPTAHDQTVNIRRNETYVGRLRAEDPLGRRLTYVLSDLPDAAKVGSISLVGGGTSGTTNEFSFTPVKDFEGEVTFKFHVTVAYAGGIIESNEATVKLNVGNFPTTTTAVYSDMVNHWAAASVNGLASLGIVRGETIGFSTTGTPTGNIEERSFFRPEDTLTRGEFIMWLVAAMKIKPDTSDVTLFSDTVPSWLVGPSNAAYNANIVFGTLVGGRRLLKAGENLTRLEAAVMVDRAMTLNTSDATPTFVDWSTVPEWGQQAVKNLHGYQILMGTPTGHLYPHAALTRAEAAEILFKSYKEAGLAQS